MCKINCYRIVEFQDGARQHPIAVYILMHIVCILFFHLANHINFIHNTSRCTLYLTDFWHNDWLIYSLFCQICASLSVSSILSCHCQAMTPPPHTPREHRYPGIGKPSVCFHTLDWQASIGNQDFETLTVKNNEMCVKGPRGSSRDWKLRDIGVRTIGSRLYTPSHMWTLQRNIWVWKMYASVIIKLQSVFVKPVGTFISVLMQYSMMFSFWDVWLCHLPSAI